MREGCSIYKCEDPAVDFIEHDGERLYLCAKHWDEWQKQAKEAGYVDADFFEWLKQKEKKEKMTIQDVKKMLEDGVPRKEIQKFTGFSPAEISHFAVAWNIPKFTKSGRPRRGDEPRRKKS